MLKKFLTTIIVLAATATAWAEGWGVNKNYVTSGGNGNADGMNDYGISVITWSESESMTLADAITAANNATDYAGSPTYMIRIIGDISSEDQSVLSNIQKEKVDLSQVTGMTNFGVFAENTAVKYVILPDNTPKANVDALGKTVDAAASKKAHTEIVWKYYRKGEPTVYNGGRYEEGGIVKGKVSEEATLNNETKLYDGIVFYDKSGNAYQTSNNSKSVQLTAYTERYTYNDNGTTRLYPNDSGYYVVSENGGYVGVQTSSTVTVEKKDVKYTYEKEDGKTYAYSFREYGKWDNYIGKKGEQFYMLEGGSFVDIQTETKWIIESTSEVYNEVNGRLVTDNNIGHVDGTKIPLTKVSAYYYDDNIYEGPIRIVGEKAYGRNGGTLVELSLVYYYEDWNDYNTVKPADKETFYVNYNGTKVATGNGFFEVTLNANGQYVNVSSGDIQYGATDQSIFRKLSDDGKMYMNWSNPTTYDVDHFGYEYPDGTTCTEVYTKDGKYYGYTDGTEIELENIISYTTKEGGETYDGDVYTYNNEYFGYNDGTAVELKEEISEYYTQWGVTYTVTKENYKSEDGKKVYVGGTQTPLTLYNKEAYVITTTGELHTGRVCNETTGLIGGTVTTPVTYSAEGYYYNPDYVYTGEYVTKKANDYDSVYGCTDNSVLSPLEAVYQYTYIDPITGDNVVYETMEQESSVTVTHEVELTSSEESAGKVHLIAYVSKPGSLTYTLARWSELDVTNGKHSGYDYTVTDVTALTLSGDVNYADIGTTGNEITAYGHVVYTDNGQSVTPERPEHDKSVQNSSPAMNGNALTYIDLTDAVFAVQTDMQFAKVNTGLKTVILPTDESMYLIPDNAFNNMHYVSDLCIPYNYKVIGSGAFFNTHSLTHIYTTDPNEGTIVENGPYTFTFSANLEEIEGGSTNLGGPGATFFGNDMAKVTDIYVLAEKAPLCGAGAFDGPMAYGNNGFAGDLAHPIGRHNYKNGDKWFVVLHYPSELAGTEEEKKYTDVTRVYTLADETGAVDGRGHAMMWPKHLEFGLAFRTALDGKLYDGTTEYDRAYQGWHEIVLTGNSLARDFDPQTENTEFVYRDWLTICVPYDMKKSQLLSLLGVDPTKNANGAEGVIYEYVCVKDANGNPVKDAEGNYTFEYKEIQRTNAPLYPDVRALTHVSRSVDSRKMTLHFTKLIEQNEIAALSEGGSNETTVTTHDVAINESHGQGFTKTEQTEDDPVVMKGGHPYLIRAYVPKEWNDQIKNLGMYIMAAASSANHAATEQGIGESELPYQYGDCTVQASGVEMYLPCLKHKVHAFDADSNTEINSVVAKDKHESFSYIDTDKDAPILYHFIGTYTETKIPQYAYYIGKTKEGVHKFSRTTKTGANAFTWAPYTAVIIGLSAPNYYAEAFDDKATGTAGSIDNIVVQPGVTGDDLKIYVGEDEKLGASGARLSLGGFDDSTVTGIVDVNVNSNVNISNNKVYSINGQYMGTSLNNLPKGIYIINGQKKVVK